ncbi:rhodanese-like domain-containing protein [Streptomyces sp. P6-2-1]|uniref:rhodanese-like domain-containing protein n=1 Tax=unclassified Streptomyces TaxID=2593676 RepID=UPI003D36CCF7
MHPTTLLGAFAEPAAAAAHFRTLLAHAADVSDLAAALADGGDPGVVLVDTRSDAAWAQGRIPGARHLPTAVLAAGAHGLDPAVPVVVHCWGPGCDGARRAALVLAEQGYRVKELMGGFEYWVREGFPYETGTAPAVTRRDPADRLTAPLAADDCGC